MARMDLTITGINPNDQSGYSVSSAGDVNADGVADLIIGAEEQTMMQVPVM